MTYDCGAGTPPEGVSRGGSREGGALPVRSSGREAPKPRPGLFSDAELYAAARAALEAGLDPERFSAEVCILAAAARFRLVAADVLRATRTMAEQSERIRKRREALAALERRLRAVLEDGRVADVEGLRALRASANLALWDAMKRRAIAAGRQAEAFEAAARAEAAFDAVVEDCKGLLDRPGWLQGMRPEGANPLERLSEASSW